MQVSGASSISCCSSLIACGCNEGIIRLFETETLLYKATLPRPLADDPDYIEFNNKKLPDVKSVVISSDGCRLCALYADRSVLVFDISNVKNVTRVYSSMCHMRCVWDVACFPPNTFTEFPRGGFITAAADNSVRIWHMPNESSSSSSAAADAAAASLHPLSSDMCRMTFMSERTPTDSVRCLKISPDFSKLITGDKAGRVKMFSLPSVKLLCSIDAHEAEVRLSTRKHN
jgi:WD40 repeat protein